jgi:DNA (cytosine-5)-methyltransferase 1
MNRPRLLDLFCGAGGCGVGYRQAGFDVVGVDLLDQPDYPFEFHQADAMTYPLDGDWDAIHASPPCQAFTSLKVMHNAREHEDLLTETRERLQAWGGLYVIENVPGAPMRNHVTICGSSIGLGVRKYDRELRRHRHFEVTSPSWSRRARTSAPRSGFTATTPATAAASPESETAASTSPTWRSSSSAARRWVCRG